jgi:tetratricopeptide (TPR) repeat protein
METATFVPKLPNKADSATKHLRRLGQFSFLITLMLFPLFVLPQTAGLTFFPKVFLVLFGSLLTLVFVSLMTLRSGTIILRVTPILIAWGLVVLAGVVSAVFSPNLSNALFGDALEIHTVGFLAILGLIMCLLPIVGDSKKFFVYLYGSFVVSACFAGLLFLLRVLFGGDFLSLGVLQSLPENFIGSFNDLGILFGCIVMVALVALAQLDLPNKGLAVIGVVLLLALLVLANVNFSYIWLLTALFSLMILMYVLTKDRFGKSDETQTHQSMPLTGAMMIGTVFLVSTVFLIGGSTIGTVISNATGVNYIEIRPSLTATTDVLRSVYSEHAVVGIGPNRFVEAWNLYKDSSINATVFWNTPFTAGAGYIPTWFVTSGILGLLAWILFLITFLYTSVKTLLLSKESDSFWFFIGTVSFVAGLYLWIISLIYVPGPTILLLAGVCTGGLLVVQKKLSTSTSRTLNLLNSSKTGFILIACVMIVIIGTLFVGYGASKQAAAAYTFVRASSNIPAESTEAITIISQRIIKAYSLYQSDTYARSLANYQLSYLNTLLAVSKPTTQQQQQFQNAISAALNASTEAISRKSTDARNWQMLADIYAGLSLLKIEGAKERAFESYKEAEMRDPRNPLYVLQKAAIEAREGNPDEARRLAILSLELKPNFTDALLLLSQLDIAAGDIPTAITRTQSIISIEANNPGRYYQLGVLYGAIQNTDAAIEAFKIAIALNPNYANARYFLAQQYLIKDDTAAAIAELEIVRDLNPDNASVEDLIKKIASGEITASALTNTPVVSEAGTVETSDGVTTADTVPDSELLTPVNSGGNQPAATSVETDSSLVESQS